jgi:hypothetical protein
VANWVAGKGLRKCSSEIYDDFEDQGKMHGKVLRRIALLGSEQPQIKTLADLPMPVKQFSEKNHGTTKWVCYGGICVPCQEAEAQKPFQGPSGRWYWSGIQRFSEMKRAHKKPAARKVRIRKFDESKSTACPQEQHKPGPCSKNRGNAGVGPKEPRLPVTRGPLKSLAAGAKGVAAAAGGALAGVGKGLAGVKNVAGKAVQFGLLGPKAFQGVGKLKPPKPPEDENVTAEPLKAALAFQPVYEKRKQELRNKRNNLKVISDYHRDEMNLGGQKALAAKDEFKNHMRERANAMANKRLKAGVGPRAKLPPERKGLLEKLHLASPQKRERREQKADTMEHGKKLIGELAKWRNHAKTHQALHQQAQGELAAIDKEWKELDAKNQQHLQNVNEYKASKRKVADYERGLQEAQQELASRKKGKKAKIAPDAPKRPEKTETKGGYTVQPVVETPPMKIDPWEQRDKGGSGKPPPAPQPLKPEKKPEEKVGNQPTNPGRSEAVNKALNTLNKATQEEKKPTEAEQEKAARGAGNADYRKAQEEALALKQAGFSEKKHCMCEGKCKGPNKCPACARKYSSSYGDPGAQGMSAGYSELSPKLKKMAEGAKQRREAMQCMAEGKPPGTTALKSGCGDHPRKFGALAPGVVIPKVTRSLLPRIPGFGDNGDNGIESRETSWREKKSENASGNRDNPQPIGFLRLIHGSSILHELVPQVLAQPVQCPGG